MTNERQFSSFCIPYVSRLFLTSLVTVLLFSSQCRSVDLVFEDTFDNGLSDKWQVVGLKKEEDYRIRDGGLEMRVQPGKLTPDTPMLKVILPIDTTDSFRAEARSRACSALVCRVPESCPSAN